MRSPEESTRDASSAIVQVKQHRPQLSTSTTRGSRCNSSAVPLHRKDVAKLTVAARLNHMTSDEILRELEQLHGYKCVPPHEVREGITICD